MRGKIMGLAMLAGTGAVSLSPGSAQAQLLDHLKGAAGMGQNGSAPNSGGGMLGGGMLGGGVPSVGGASTGNLAGVLKYCMQNNYLGGSDASSTETGLLGKLGGNAGSSSQFQSGSAGNLQTGQGGGFSLGGGGLKAKLTQKVCDQVLSRAKSLI